MSDKRATSSSEEAGIPDQRSGKCMIGDPITKPGDPHVTSGHVSDLDKPERAVRDNLYAYHNSDLTIPPDLAEMIVDAETGGRKGAKAARFSYIPPDVLWELAEHYQKGLAKYPDDEDGKANWQRGYDWRLSVDALMRHFMAFLMGEDFDPETGSSHLIAAIWHLFALRWFQLHGKGRDFR